MKKWTFTLVMLFCFGFTQAQKDSSFFELGINGLSLINRNQVNPAGSFLLTLEKGGPKIGIRAGVGYTSLRSTEKPSVSNGNTEFQRDTTQFNLRMGLVLYKNFNQKFSLKYGIDARFSNLHRSGNTTFVDSQGAEVNTSSTYNQGLFGVSPFIYFQYHITKNFSVGTELSVLFSKVTIEDSVTSEIADFNSILVTEQSYNKVEIPNALYLVVRF